MYSHESSQRAWDQILQPLKNIVKVFEVQKKEPDSGLKRAKTRRE